MTRQLGFTLLETMIALLVGGVLLGGVMYTYVGMKSTTKDTLALGELHETGRYALQVLTQDIEQSGFFGNLSIKLSRDVLVKSGAGIPNVAGDCGASINNKTFPDGTGSAFKTIFAVTHNDRASLLCIPSTSSESDIVQIKRVIANPVLDGGNLSKDTAYLVSNNDEAYILTGQTKLNSTIQIGSAWPYRHVVYYIKNRSFEYDGNSVTVPTLYERHLTAVNGNLKMNSPSVPVVEGVEHLRFVFGIDRNLDNQVDTYLTTQQMQLADWEQETSKILTVQVFVLVRSLLPDFSKKKKATVFQLGPGNSEEQTLRFNDWYSRLLLVSTIRVSNSLVEEWAE